MEYPSGCPKPCARRQHAGHSTAEAVRGTWEHLESDEELAQPCSGSPQRIKQPQAAGHCSVRPIPRGFHKLEVWGASRKHYRLNCLSSCQH